MKHLSKEKRDRIVLIVIGTIIVLVGGWYTVINQQKARLNELNKTISDQQIKVDNGLRLLNSRGTVDERVASAGSRLRELESHMAAGDMYSWIILKVNRFKANYKVEIPQFTREVTGELELLPKFPYRAATFTVRGTAYFHDFGTFLADFENAFPYMHVRNLEMEPASTTAANAPKTGRTAEASDTNEQIAFRMEIVALINPGLY